MVVIVLVISICSTRASAARSTVSSKKFAPSVVNAKVVSAARTAPEGVTFVPDQLLYSPPYTFCVTVSFTVCVVVVVAFIDPWVNCGVIVFALATEGDNSAKSISHRFILLFS